jgi:hypothetical protein
VFTMQNADPHEAAAGPAAASKKVAAARAARRCDM